ncbi:GDSL-type esterase/lipase family protein [Hymenobacter sp. J193]|uniref:SGNH/GDSL hydrolase family protein n=1 Tax=Hymenobacter sp. J193 TaxID=2898429 RepID=UPI0021514402|nr:GDSL-type esterase/lipase family protein [Hymenobacter sp. J193]MCR5888777.1 GDSL-type esterase/lipase family protein [Hymenobacter sp. J193]
MRILFVLLLVLGFGCSSSGEEPTPTAGPAITPLPAPAGPAIRFLSLGDSYTIGEGAAEADRWSVQLAWLAQAQGLNLQPPTIIARTGWTTAELQSAIQEANLPKDFGLVSLLIGVNNQYRGQPLATYRTDFRLLLQTAIRLAAGRPSRVLMLSIPDWGRTPYAQSRNPERIASEIDQFNAVAQEESQAAGVAFVDITPATRAAAGDVTQFTADGLHYSGQHMAQWAQLALPVVQQQLK